MSGINGLDRAYINHIRGVLILRVVLSHLGLAWVYQPYSSYIGIFFPSLFMVSGVVTYYSYLRAKSPGAFLNRRLIRLYIPYIAVTVVAFIIYAIYTGSFNITISSIIDWLVMNIAVENEPYHLGQVWFLRSLVIITLIALPFFIVSKKFHYILLIPVVFSALLALSQSYFGTGNKFWLVSESLNNYNLYHPLVNLGYYVFGAWVFISERYSDQRFMLTLCLASMGLSILQVFLVTDFSFVLSDHSYYQDFYYLTCGYFGMTTLFVFRPILEKIFSVNIISKILMFFSVNAFIVYLIHSFFIQFTEDVWGWENLGDDYRLALIKIVFVIAMTCICSIPLTKITKFMTMGLLSR